MRVKRLQCTIFAGQKKSSVSNGLENPKRVKKYLLETSAETGVLHSLIINEYRSLQWSLKEPEKSGSHEFPD